MDYIEIPKRFEEMKTIAKELSKDFPLVRVDFYNLKDKLLVEELTFYPNAGLTKYDSIEWDCKFGKMIDLNKIPKEHLAKEWIDILNKDQTKPNYFICSNYICFYHNLKYKKYNLFMNIKK
ncbi:ATP-grasp fold amidoligase family protein [Brachyspira intermedia]|uniref:ATP-grasp fold amidoligase family protein n=1 Tax=Brachyspira intermedia TaxID=84377 RepID=UPI003003CB33